MITTIIQYLPRGLMWRINSNSIIHLILKVLADELELIQDNLAEMLTAFLLQNDKGVSNYNQQYGTNFINKEEIISHIQSKNILTLTIFENLIGKGSLSYVDNSIMTCQSNCQSSIGYERGNFLVEVKNQLTSDEYNSIKNTLIRIKHAYNKIIINVEGVRTFL